MRQLAEIKRSNYPYFTEVLVEWANRFDFASVLNSNGYEDTYGQYILLAGIGHKRLVKKGSIQEIRELYAAKKTWLFGHLGYDLKNQIENLSTKHLAQFDFGDLTFFEPEFVVQQKRGNDSVQIWGESLEGIQPFLEMLETYSALEELSFPMLQPKMSRGEYLEAIRALKVEIQYGNIYEINYCQEFYAEGVELDCSATYARLNKKSAMPFSAFYKNQTETLLCASPERFLTKRGNKVYSQPIKGTVKRGTTEVEDAALKVQLKSDLKEQTENVMIVDLVRNDLSRTAVKASVKVEELFGVYPFPQVHQLISTVSSTLKSDKDLFDLIETTFPMGSMTGAPKISAMKLADKHEKTRRELYSGSVGYIAPNGDVDFNVVIRSLMYSTKSKRLSLMVGGAITHMADPEMEYEECLLKAKAVLELGKE